MSTKNSIRRSGLHPTGLEGEVTGGAQVKRTGSRRHFLHGWNAKASVRFVISQTLTPDVCRLYLGKPRRRFPRTGTRERPR
jgi:hypothetical protein